MKLIDKSNTILINRILTFLYEDELLNTFLISELEQKDIGGDLYTAEVDSSIVAVLDINFDGNSNFTSFYLLDNAYLLDISDELKRIDKKVLLAGKADWVKIIMLQLNIGRPLWLNKYYSHNGTKQDLKDGLLLERLTRDSSELSKVKKFIVGFFEAETEVEINDVTNDDKLNLEIDKGYYILKYNNEVVGIARFSGQSEHYIDITTVYIDPPFRGRGYGKELMKQMVIEAYLLGKTPVTQTSARNVPAMKIYESIGFIRYTDYAFEFIL